MNKKHSREMDKLDKEQNTLLALAAYDWHFFNDNRIANLKKDYSITASNKDIFVYYYTDKPHLVEIYQNRYVNHYKAMLQAIIYA